MKQIDLQFIQDALVDKVNKILKEIVDNQPKPAVEKEPAKAEPKTKKGEK